jgi:S1-C subfamily serine protease
MPVLNNFLTFEGLKFPNQSFGMKTIFTFIIICLFSFLLKAQVATPEVSSNPAFLYFIYPSGMYYNNSAAIYMNEHQIYSMTPGMLLNYKVKSEGLVNIILDFNSRHYNLSLDVVKGSKHYLVADANYGTLKEVDSLKAFEYILDPRRISKSKSLEENDNAPVTEGAEGSEDHGKFIGTGFLISTQGYVVTNSHVVNGAKTIELKGIGGDYSTRYTAKIVSDDQTNDLAILEIINKNIRYDSIPYQVRVKTGETGESIYILGYPKTTYMGEEIKLTTGVISAKSGYNGNITSYQISAPAQPGNSGGPMLDADGNLLGIVNAKIMDAENVTYAIKTNYLQTLVDVMSTPIMLPNKASLKGKSLQEQVKALSKFVYIIEVTK